MKFPSPLYLPNSKRSSEVAQPCSFGGSQFENFSTRLAVQELWTTKFFTRYTLFACSFKYCHLLELDVKGAALCWTLIPQSLMRGNNSNDLVIGRVRKVVVYEGGHVVCLPSVTWNVVVNGGWSLLTEGGGGRKWGASTVYIQTLTKWRGSTVYIRSCYTACMPRWLPCRLFRFLHIYSTAATQSIDNSSLTCSSTRIRDIGIEWTKVYEQCEQHDLKYINIHGMWKQRAGKKDHKGNCAQLTSIMMSVSRARSRVILGFQQCQLSGCDFNVRTYHF